MPLSPEEYQFIEQQLGREPRGCIAIAARKNTIPTVLQVRSWVANQPFPTLYWLCSKDIGKAISGLEGKGLVKVLEQRLLDDEALLHAYLQDHQRYIQKRWELMHPEDKAILENKGHTELFHKLGIGGIAEHNKIRCLHMQYAYHLVEGSAIGRLLDEEFGIGNTTIHS